MATTTTTQTPQLPIVSYELLKSGSQDEIKKLVAAASDRGVFFLDLRGPLAHEALADLQSVYKVEQTFFAHTSDEIKGSFFRDGIDRGYKKRGPAETFEISREEQLLGTLQLPPVLEAESDLLSRFATFGDTLTRYLFKLVSESLNPPAPTIAGNDPQKPGDSEVTFGRSNAPTGQPLVPSHSDSGLITLLYYDQPSLEIPIPGTDEWEIVHTIKDHHLIYVGRSLQESSNGRLHAPLHRVVQPEGDGVVAVYLLHPGQS